MTFRGRGKEKDQFEVQQPTVANVLDQLQTRSGKSYQRTPAVKKASSIPTLYVANREELRKDNVYCLQVELNHRSHGHRGRGGDDSVY